MKLPISILGLLVALIAGCDGGGGNAAQQPQGTSSQSAGTGTTDNGAIVEVTSNAEMSAQTSTASTEPAGQQSTPQPSASGGGGGNDDDAAAQRLYGTWEAENVEAPIGDVRVRLTFKEEGPVRIAAWSELPLVGQVRDKKGPYEVQGNKITSEAIRGGTTVQYRFDGDDVLVIEYTEGKSVRFHRQK
ncbi:MAG TPA: hypothetical protein VGN72_11190 [Tepidisphaeraceae bacterium]|jgi:hypothetical protein|nr:hypothetical protein [Tepidisphaeraceae bacterium]